MSRLCSQGPYVSRRCAESPAPKSRGRVARSDRNHVRHAPANLKHDGVGSLKSKERARPLPLEPPDNSPENARGTDSFGFSRLDRSMTCNHFLAPVYPPGYPRRIFG